MAAKGSISRLVASFGGGAVAGGFATDLLYRSKSDDQSHIISSGSLKALESHSALNKHGRPQHLIPSLPLCYKNHCLEFDPQRKTPKWVSEHLSRDKIEPKGDMANRKKAKFQPDPNLPSEVRPDNKDFWNSGWSRGHMAPAGNNKFSQDAMNDTFFLSNIVPQDIQNNGDFWNRMEIYCRDLTKTFKDVWVVSGPLWLPTEVNTDEEVERSLKKYGIKRKPNKVVRHEVIGESQVSVPTHLYKVILAEGGDGKPLLSSFVVPNAPIKRDKVLKDYKIPIDTLEKHVGFKFFHKLDRSQVDDLCDVNGCQLQDFKEFQAFYTLRGIRGARNMRELDRYLNRAKKLDVVTPEILQNYDQRLSELAKVQEQEKKEEKKVAEAA